MTKKDDKQYLMKRRRYGWGWIPVTWRAVLLIGMQIAIIFTATAFLPAKPVQPTVGELFAFFVIVALSISTIVLFGLISAPKLAWRWGKKSTDNPDEDF
jgi:hypothetical protein